MNAITVDLEDWFALVSRRFGVPLRPSRRVLHSTEQLLSLLKETGTTATFFVLGEIADAFPDLIGAVAAGGHEIATHGYRHRRVDELTPQEFRADLQEAIRAVERAGAPRPCGHRAPEFSITERNLWAFDVLTELGFRYDSSVFPIRHRRYGMPNAPTRPFDISTSAGALREFPLATLQVFGARIPAAGGGYLRYFPYAVVETAVRQLNSVDAPAVIYVHPYEFDCSRLSVETRTLRQSAFVATQNAFRRRSPVRLRRLLTTFSFGPLGPLAR